MYFRQMHDLPKHIGLDLFSDDPSLVVAGDMHKMPFPDSYFSFVFLKNVIDKSYNARVLIRELIRVVRPGGIVICDNDCSYGVTDPLGRTDIQKSANLFRAFKARSFVVPLICKDYDTPQSRSRRVVRLAMRIFKSGTGQLAA